MKTESVYTELDRWESRASATTEKTQREPAGRHGGSTRDATVVHVEDGWHFEVVTNWMEREPGSSVRTHEVVFPPSHTAYTMVLWTSSGCGAEMSTDHETFTRPGRELTWRAARRGMMTVNGTAAGAITLMTAGMDVTRRSGATAGTIAGTLGTEAGRLNGGVFGTSARRRLGVFSAGTTIAGMEAITAGT